MVYLDGSELGRGKVSFYIGITLKTGMRLERLEEEITLIRSKHPGRIIEVGPIDKEHIIFIVRPRP